MALDIESQGEFERHGIPVLYCGIGKVNAAHALMKRLGEYQLRARPLPQVLNFGTVGSRCLPQGTLVECHEFVQRDMDVSGLGFAPGVTPYETIPPLLSFPRLFPHLAAAPCGSGDSFATSAPLVACDVVDMEAYALAKVAHLEGASFACVKYVSDGADHSAAKDWRANLHRAAELFIEQYRWLAVELDSIARA
jgi:adenosylhomocysteine nucleosidase